MSKVLHYVYDPLCGWCYCAEPLVNAASEVEGLKLELHGGGLWPEPTRLPDEMRSFIREADARAAAISGQPYGKAYLDGLLADPTLTLESRPTTAAVLAAEAMSGAGLDMLRAIQHAHWEHGRKVVEPEVLGDIASVLGLERTSFETQRAEAQVDEHIATSRRLMQRIGAGGFPAFVLQMGEQWYGVPHQQFAANPAGFADWLRQMLTQQTAASSG
jgi:putative protein-disulfide isomerase